MSDRIVQNLKLAWEEENIKKSDILFIVDKLERRKEKNNIKPINILKPNQRVNLSRFLNKYKPYELLLVRCKESFQIEDLYFKKDHYYVLTFVGILKTHAEVPFFIHDICVYRNDDKEITYKVQHDSFRIKTKHLFKAFHFIKSIGMNEYRNAEKWEYVYFNYNRLADDCEVMSVFSNQSSVYDNKDFKIN